MAYDFSPLYRSMIGVDRMAHFGDTAMQSEADTSYGPRLRLPIQGGVTDHNRQPISSPSYP